MVVNREQEELDALLVRAPRMVKPGGRIVINLLYVLEDRKSKRVSGVGASGRALILTKKPLTPESRSYGTIRRPQRQVESGGDFGQARRQLRRG